MVAATLTKLAPLISQLLTLPGRPDIQAMRPLLLLTPVGFVFVGGLATVSGVGMLVGKPWGWWVGAFYYFYSVFLGASAALNVFGIA